MLNLVRYSIGETHVQRLSRLHRPQLIVRDRRPSAELPPIKLLPSLNRSSCEPNRKALNNVILRAYFSMESILKINGCKAKNLQWRYSAFRRRFGNIGGSALKNCTRIETQSPKVNSIEYPPTFCLIVTCLHAWQSVIT